MPRNARSATPAGRRRTIRTALSAGILLLIAGAAAATWGFGRGPAAVLDDFDRYVFVPSRGAAEVAVIDADSDRVIATLALEAPAGQIVISDVTGLLIASDLAGRRLSLIDLGRREPTVSVPLDLRPDHMQLSPDGYILAIGDVDGGKVSLYSLFQRRELARIDDFVSPYNFTFSPDGSQIFVADLGSNRVGVVSVAQGRVIDSIPVGADGPDDGVGVTNVTGTPDGRFGFTTLEGADELAILDLETGRPLKTVRLDERPWRAYGTADGRLMMIPNNGGRSVTILDTGLLEPVATLPGAADVTAINTGWFDSAAYVMSRGERKVVVLDLIGMRKLRDIELPGMPGPGVVTPDGRRLYVALSDTDQMAVIDAREGTLISVIDNVGRDPWGATMGHSNNYCH